MRGLALVIAAATIASMANDPAMAQPSADITAMHDGLSAPLSGTLTGELSAERPVILIVPGSGPTDRDGNSPVGIQAAPYRLLAEELAGEGVASVRIDKRGLFASAGAGHSNAVTVADYVADLAAWSEAIASRRGGGCTWLFGHSEGGVMALAAVAADPPRYCGMILAAAPGRPLGDILREQLRANPANAPLLSQAEAAIAALEAGAHYDTSDLHPALQPLFAPPLQDFLISLFAQDPAALIAATDRPVLIMQGRTDLQIGVQDAEALAAARPDAMLVLLDGVNHVLKAAPEDRAANIATYADPDLPLADGVVETIADFVNAER